jgi:hypothetical protein
VPFVMIHDPRRAPQGAARAASIPSCLPEESRISILQSPCDLRSLWAAKVPFGQRWPYRVGDLALGGAAKSGVTMLRRLGAAGGSAKHGA